MADLGDFVGTLRINSDTSGINEASQAMDKAKESGSLLDSVTNCLVFTFGDLINIGMKVVDALNSIIVSAADNEQAIQRLSVAMQAQGIYSQIALDDNIAFAKSLQESTTYSKQQIESIMIMYTQLGMHGQQLQDATIATLNLGAATGNLEGAQTSIARSYEGITSRLLRLYGVDLPAGTKGTDALNSVVSQLSQNLGNTASSATETYNGKISQLTNSFTTLKEEIGSPLLTPLKELIDTLIQDVRSVSESKNGWEGFLNALAAISPIGGTVKTVFQGMTQAHKQMTADITDDEVKAGKAMIEDYEKQSNAEIAAAKKKAQEKIDADNKVRAAMDKNIATWQKTNEAALATQEADQARTDIKLISLDAEKYQQSISFQQSELNALIISNQAKGQSYKEYSDQVERLEMEKAKTIQAYRKEVTDDFASGIDEMLKGQKSFSEMCGDIYDTMKDQILSMLAQIIAKEIILLAIEAFTGTLNMAGASSIDMVKKVAGFAQGGTNIPAQLALVGEDGPELMQIPGGSNIYSNPQTQSMLAGAGGGGGMTFIINANGPSNKLFADQIGDVIMRKFNANRKW